MSHNSLIQAILLVAMCTSLSLGFTPFRKPCTPEQLRELGISVMVHPREGSDEEWLEIRFDSSQSRQGVESFEVFAHLRRDGKRIAVAKTGRTKKGNLKVISNKELKNERSYFGITAWKKNAGASHPSGQVIQIAFREFAKLSSGQKPRNAKQVSRPQCRGESTRPKVLMLTPGHNLIGTAEDSAVILGL